MSALAYDVENIEEIRLLRFNVFNQEGKELQFAMNTHKIREVIEWEDLSPLPDNVLPFIGVYNLRGTPVPVLDLSLKLISERTIRRDRPRPRIIICEVMRRLIGLLVPKTTQITTHGNNEVIPPASDLADAPGLFVNGLLRTENGHFTYLLDIEALLSSISPASSGDRAVSKQREFPGRRVLIVEDSRFFQRQACQLFEGLGFTVDLAGNGEEGLKKLHDARVRYDLIFSDIEMPVRNGIEMVMEIKRDPNLKDIPVIFNTSISNPTLIEEIRNRGLGEYIVKFDPELILKTLDKTLSS